ncbi:SitI3 family protein [Actinoplanes couchii]|uniref:Uncharacterized protein n=1 Tax=Actinoplanes couchii TaxID=403638 RepID=A0ABQ3X8X3_9ACTN|nr:SitI3 family protein [Actinoplanes couchii]MDR6325889.1 hypothetical protein [Actinoplanes couchii]GID54941.1 hypothetical protein Aco03nite_033450 [Actinoplanes couchii]
MAFEYELILIGDGTAEQIAERAFPDPAERPAGAGPVLHSTGLRATHGFDVTLLTREFGYVSAESDDGMWEFEPDAHVSLTFYLDKSAEPEQSVPDMLTVVRRLLDTGPEDAVLLLDGDVLLLTRFAGALLKHRRNTWWNHHPAANTVIDA